MVRLLSSPAMQTIQHYNLLFYWYTDIRVWGKRASIDHIRILPFQLYSSSLLGFGGRLEQNWGANNVSGSFMEALGRNDADQQQHPARQSKQSPLDLVLPMSTRRCWAPPHGGLGGLSIRQTSTLWQLFRWLASSGSRTLGRWRPHWPDTDGSFVVHSPLCPSSLWVSFIYSMDSSLPGLSLCACTEISTTGSCSQWPSRQDSGKNKKFY